GDGAVVVGEEFVGDGGGAVEALPGDAARERRGVVDLRAERRRVGVVDGAPAGVLDRGGEPRGRLGDRERLAVGALRGVVGVARVGGLVGVGAGAEGGARARVGDVAVGGHRLGLGAVGGDGAVFVGEELVGDGGVSLHAALPIAARQRRGVVDLRAERRRVGVVDGGPAGVLDRGGESGGQLGDRERLAGGALRGVVGVARVGGLVGVGAGAEGGARARVGDVAVGGHRLGLGAVGGDGAVVVGEELVGDGGGAVEALPGDAARQRRGVVDLRAERRRVGVVDGGPAGVLDRGGEPRGQIGRAARRARGALRGVVGVARVGGLVGVGAGAEGGARARVGDVAVGGHRLGLGAVGGDGAVVVGEELVGDGGGAVEALPGDAARQRRGVVDLRAERRRVGVVDGGPAGVLDRGGEPRG